MTAILRQLPFFETEDEVHVGLERVPIKPYQIIAWFSLTARDVIELPPQAPRFPAITDTAHNHNFSIQGTHLARWAKLQEAALPVLSRVRERGRHAPLYAANLWVHPNRPGKRDEFSGEPAFLLRLKQGMTVYPSGVEFPRLPLLGLRTLVRNELHFTMDPERCMVNLRTSDWLTRLLRWLS